VADWWLDHSQVAADDIADEVMDLVLVDRRSNSFTLDHLTLRFPGGLTRHYSRVI